MKVEISGWRSVVSQICWSSMFLCISKSVLSSTMVRMKDSPPAVCPDRLGSVETHRNPMVLGCFLQFDYFFPFFRFQKERVTNTVSLFSSE